jgi:hypothetical protein
MEHTDGYPPASPESVRAYQMAQACKAVHIPAVEARGRLSYLVGDEVREFTGWVHCWDGHRVNARKIGGRNTWQITTVEAVVSFQGALKMGSR